MYIHSSAFQYLLPGEPTLDAIHREEYHANKASLPDGETLIAPSERSRVALLRAEVALGVGRFFA